MLQAEFGLCSQSISLENEREESEGGERSKAEVNSLLVIGIRHELLQ